MKVIQMLMGNEHRVYVLYMLTANRGRMSAKMYNPFFEQRVGEKPNILSLDEYSRMP